MTRSGPPPAPVVGVSPIIGGAPVRGMADAVPAQRGDRGERGGGRAATTVRASEPGGLLDAWLVDTADAGATIPGVRGRRAAAADAHPAEAAALASAALEVARAVG